MNWIWSFSRNQSLFFCDDFFGSIGIDACINAKKTNCGTNKENVKNNIKKSLAKIKKINSKISELTLRIPDINIMLKEVKNELA